MSLLERRGEEVWNGFLLVKVKGPHVPCRFCCGDDGYGHFFWDCTFPPLVEIRQHPEFHDLMEVDQSNWPRCLLWHGWFPLLSGVDGASPWAEDPVDGAGNLLEYALGPYTSGLFDDWQLPVGFDAEGAAENVAATPDVWADGSLVEDKVSGACSSGSGFFSGRTSLLWTNRWWGHLDDDLGGEMLVGSCRGFCSLPGPLQSVQRAEFWERLFLHFRLLMAFMLYVMSVACWMAMLALVLLSLSRMVILFCLLVGFFGLVGWIQFGLLRLRVMLMRIG